MQANAPPVYIHFKLRHFSVFFLFGRFRRLQQPADCASFPSWINTQMRQLLVLETTHTFFPFPLCPHVPLFFIPLLFFCPSAPYPLGLFLSRLKTLTYIYLHTQERSCTALAFSQQLDAMLLLWDTGGFIFLFFFCDLLPHDWLPCAEDRGAILCPVASAGSPF